MRRKIIGYIVLNGSFGHPWCHLSTKVYHAPKGGVLCQGRPAHLFDTRREARRAIAVAASYWPKDTVVNYKICPIVK